ncbi:MAG: Holliday junction resolvase RuvX [Myxococcota bacterium]
MGPVLALDVGTQVIGVAVSDPGRRFVFPVHTLARRSVAKDTDALARLCREKGVTQLVVGLALDEAGHEGRVAKLARQVGDALAAKTGLPLAYVDERYTTAEARQRLDEGGVPRGLQRAVVDQQAAMVMLEEWLARSG